METGNAATEILFDGGGGGQSMAATREVVSPYIKGVFVVRSCDRVKREGERRRTSSVASVSHSTHGPPKLDDEMR